MVLQQRLSLKLGQRLVMTPSLQQAIKLLQMTRLELEDALNQELVENPMLEDGEEETASEDMGVTANGAEQNVAEATATGADGGAGTDADEVDPPEEAPDEPAMSDIDLDAYFNDYLGSESTVASTFENRDVSALENNLTREPDLYDHLRWQLRMSDAPPRLREIAELVIGNLNGEGFLQASVEELQLLGAAPREVIEYRERSAADQPVSAPGHPVSAVESALALVRSFDPVGVGWHTLQESLLAQLEARRGQDGLAYRIVKECWDLFTRRQFRLVARRLQTRLADLEAPVEEIKALETRPGRQFSTEPTEYVEPDVVALRIDGEWAIQLNDDGLPRLRISRAYRRMLQQMRSRNGESEARDFLQDKMRSAIWLIKSLDQRQRTIYKVAESILRQQRGFFEDGIDGLKPMVLRDVADDIGMHESTVSRVVSNKYMHTPRGLLPMKFFFPSGVDCEQGGEVSSLTVKRRLRTLVEDEDGRKPLSDAALTRQLERQGIRIARRTVAKYRDELGIPSSQDRKQIF